MESIPSNKKKPRELQGDDGQPKEADAAIPPPELEDMAEEVMPELSDQPPEMPELPPPSKYAEIPLADDPPDDDITAPMSGPMPVRGAGAAQVTQDSRGVIIGVSEKEPDYEGQVLGGDLSWGKVKADWSSGNSFVVHPCANADGDNPKTEEADEVTVYAVTPVGKVLTYIEAKANDIVAYTPYGARKGILDSVVHGGTASTVENMLPASGSYETETAQADTWDRTDQGTDDGVDILWTTRIAYNHGGDKKLYAFRRTMTFDSAGMLITMSAETRVEIDATEVCP